MVAKNFDLIVEDARTEMKRGIDRYLIITNLHDQGLSIIQSMRAVTLLYDVDLGRAKELVSEHPIWATVVNASKPLHDEIVESLKRDGTLGEQPDGTIVDTHEL